MTWGLVAVCPWDCGTITPIHNHYTLVTDTAIRTFLSWSEQEYRQGTSPVSDTTWDALEAMERQRDPGFQVINPGVLPSLNSTRHEDLGDWYSRLGCPQVTVTIKIDGAALALHYHQGRLLGAWTRTGKDVLPLAKLVSSIPQVIAAQGSVLVRGELYDHVTGRQSAPAAAMRRKVPQGVGLSFAALGVIEQGGNLVAQAHQEQLTTLASWGFRVLPWVVASDLAALDTWHRGWQQCGIQALLEAQPCAIPQGEVIPSDGLVVTADLGAVRSKHPGGKGAPGYALALKGWG